MTYNLLLRHLKSQIARTPKPILLTAATIDNTPNYLIEHNYPHLADIYYQRNTTLSAIRKAAGHLNT